MGLYFPLGTEKSIPKKTANKKRTTQKDSLFNVQKDYIVTKRDSPNKINFTAISDLVF